MSEKLCRFLLPELTTVVIRCMKKGCTGAIEMSAAALKVDHQLSCPVCDAHFTKIVVEGHEQPNTLEALGAAIDAVKAQAHFRVEFVVPDPKGP
jgi:hypothetical protein